MQVMTTIELSAGEESFILGLAKGLKPTRAATAAGYSVATARILMRKPHVAAAIKHCAANMLYAVQRLDTAA